jgi:hypothetical protein
MTMSNVQVPAGWYDDGQGHQRWWDGTNWGPVAPPVVERANTSGIAVAGFILALVGAVSFGLPVLCLILLVLAVLFTSAGMIETARTPKRGRGLAIAGFIISLSVLATAILLAVIS